MEWSNAKNANCSVHAILITVNVAIPAGLPSMIYWTSRHIPHVVSHHAKKKIGNEVQYRKVNVQSKVHPVTCHEGTERRAHVQQ